jgi:hypothetical protein
MVIPALCNSAVVADAVVMPANALATVAHVVSMVWEQQ